MAVQEEVSLARLRQSSALRRARLVASLQSLAIFLLLVAMSMDYSHNQYMQAWAEAHLGALAFLLNGTLAAFYAGVMIAYYLASPSTEKVRPRLKKTEEIIISENRSWTMKDDLF